MQDHPLAQVGAKTWVQWVSFSALIGIRAIDTKHVAWGERSEIPLYWRLWSDFVCMLKKIWLWGYVKKYGYFGKRASFCVTTSIPMASCKPLKGKRLQMQENWKIAILFCHFVWLFWVKLDQWVLYQSCNTMRDTGLLGIAKAPLQKIKKACEKLCSPVIYQDISICLMKLYQNTPLRNMNLRDTFYTVYLHVFHILSPMLSYQQIVYTVAIAYWIWV